MSVSAGALTRLRVHLTLIDGGVAPVVARYGAHIGCRPGCSECCHQSFRVSELEGALLREGLAAAAPAVRAEISERAAGYEAGRGEACPVLDDGGRCQLYEHRPRICRKYGIPLWNAEKPHELSTCRLNFRGVEDLDAELIVEPQAGWRSTGSSCARSKGSGRRRTGRSRRGCASRKVDCPSGQVRLAGRTGPGGRRSIEAVPRDRAGGTDSARRRCPRPGRGAN